MEESNLNPTFKRPREYQFGYDSDEYIVNYYEAPYNGDAGDTRSEATHFLADVIHQTIEGTYGFQDDPADWWAITSPYASILNTNFDGFGKVYVDFYDHTGALITSSDGGLTTYLHGGQTVYVKVAGDSGKFGSYELDFSMASAVTPEGRFESLGSYDTSNWQYNAEPLVVGTSAVTLTGSTGLAGDDADWYRIDPSQTGTFNLILSELNEDLSVRIVGNNSLSAKLSHDYSDHTEILSAPISVDDGAFYVVVEYNADESFSNKGGDYHLTMAVDASSAEGRPESIYDIDAPNSILDARFIRPAQGDAFFEGSIGVGDDLRDYYVVDGGTAGQPVYFKMAADSGNVRVIAYNTDGDKIGSTTTAQGGSVSWQTDDYGRPSYFEILPASASTNTNYRFAVSFDSNPTLPADTGYDGNSDEDDSDDGDAIVEAGAVESIAGIDVGSSFSEAYALSLSDGVTSWTGSVGYADDAGDWFSFYPQEDGTLVIDAVPSTGGLAVQMLDANLSRLRSATVSSTQDDSLDTSLSVPVTADQLYYLSLSLSGTLNPDYTVSLNPADYTVTITPEGASGDDTQTSWRDEAEALPLTLGTAFDVQNNVGIEDDNDDYYVFTANEAQSLSLSLTGLREDADLFILSPSGAELAASERGGNSDEEISYDLSEGETVYVKVSAYRNAVTDYTLTALFGEDGATEDDDQDDESDADGDGTEGGNDGDSGSGLDVDVDPSGETPDGGDAGNTPDDAQPIDIDDGREDGNDDGDGADGDGNDGDGNDGDGGEDGTQGQPDTGGAIIIGEVNGSLVIGEGDDQTQTADTADWYSFNPTIDSLIELQLGGLNGDADLILRDGNGTLVDLSTRPGALSENLVFIASADSGPYRIGIQQSEEAEADTGTINYTLTTRVTAAPVADNPVPLTEYESAQSVARLYIAMFDRTPEAEGLDFWWDAINNGVTLDETAAAFSTEKEFTQIYGSGDEEAFVETAYNRILGREPEDVGANFWEAMIRNGLSRGQAVMLFADSIENRAISEFRIEQVLLSHGIERQEDAAEVQAEQATRAPAETITLTPLGLVISADDFSPLG